MDTELRNSVLLFDRRLGFRHDPGGFEVDVIDTQEIRQ
jgi:hypothetical protein